MASKITHGFTEPRIFTKPLRELTRETSRGFEAIQFAEKVLNVQLFPWQKWLFIHLLELNPDGTLRFRKALVIVARQNGKTLIAAVLAAFFLYVDSVRWPEYIKPRDFVIVGAAQKLDIAMKPWTQVRQWGGPDDPRIGIAHDRVPILQAVTRMPRTANGETELVTTEGAVYRPRTFEGARGYSSARLILDELREQHDYVGWSAIEKSATAMFDSLLLAFSNAGTAKSEVLRDVRTIAHESVDKRNAQWFIAEWSADEDADLDDPRAFAQANPSAGYLPAMTIDGLMQTAAEAKNKNIERIEVLCQWVSAQIEPYIDVSEWKAGFVSPFEVSIPHGSRTVWGVDVSFDRRWTWISAAVFLDDGRPFVQLRERHKSMFKAVDRLAELAADSGSSEVALQSRGSASMELVQPLREKGLTVHEIDGGHIGLATGRFRDRVRSGELAHTEQPLIDLGIEGGIVKRIAENEAWDRYRSVVDVAGVVSETVALYGLEALDGDGDKTFSAYADHGLLIL